MEKVAATTSRVRIQTNITKLQLELKELKEKKNKALPSGNTAKRNLKRDECMSREFSASSFKCNQGATLIEKLKNITNWNKPPDKDADYDDLTPEVQKAAKSYFEHLGKATPINKKVKRA